MSTSVDHASPSKMGGFMGKAKDFVLRYYSVVLLGVIIELAMAFPYRFVGLFRPIVIEVCGFTQKELGFAQSVMGMVSMPGEYIYIYIYIYNK